MQAYNLLFLEINFLYQWFKFYVIIIDTIRRRSDVICNGKITYILVGKDKILVTNQL